MEGNQRVTTGRASIFGWGAALALAAAALLFAPSARADIEFCPPGSGAGQCDSPQGIAVDYETGRLYVADRDNNRVDVFAEDGEFLFAFGWGVADGATGAPQTCGPAAVPPTAECFKGIAGPGPGQLSAPTKVAVDNDSASPSPHAVYVVDQPNFRVQKFTAGGEFLWVIGKGVDQTDGGDLCAAAEGHTCGAGVESSEAGGFKLRISVGVGPGGAVHVLDNLGKDGDPTFDHRLQRLDPDGTPIGQCVLAEDLGRASGIAVDSGGNSWVVNQLTGGGVRKYEPGCGLDFLVEDTDRVSVSIALDEADNLFAVQDQARKKPLAPRIVMITAHQPDGQRISRFGYDRAGDGELAVRNGEPGGEGGVYLTFERRGDQAPGLPAAAADAALARPGGRALEPRNEGARPHQGDAGQRSEPGGQSERSPASSTSRRRPT